MIDYHKLKNWPFADIVQTYTEKDTMSYALALGLGQDPVDPGSLRFVYEKNLQALPTMAVVLGYPGTWLNDPATGVDYVKVLHGEQSLTMHSLLPARGTVVGRSRVKSITDKGSKAGAVLIVERTLTDNESGRLLATQEQSTFCRGNGGYSESGQPSDELPAVKIIIPDRAPDISCDLPTRPETALLYRLLADRNPLHADPEIAKAAGFPRPILHGLATYGIACHAILRTCCGYDPSALKTLRVRFTAPVYPGETIRTEIWRDDNQLLFRAFALERNLMVLNLGTARLV